MCFANLRIIVVGFANLRIIVDFEELYLRAQTEFGGVL